MLLLLVDISKDKQPNPLLSIFEPKIINHHNSYYEN